VEQLDRCNDTNFQKQVIALVAEGLDNRAIGKSLDCSEEQIEKCLSVILQSLQLSSRLELIFWFLANEQLR